MISSCCNWLKKHLIKIWFTSSDWLPPVCRVKNMRYFNPTSNNFEDIIITDVCKISIYQLIYSKQFFFFFSEIYPEVNCNL